MKRLLTVVQMAVVVAIFGAAAVGLVYGWDDNILKIQGQIGLGKVPSYGTTTVLAPREVDTTLAIDARNCDKLWLSGIYKGDSCAWTVQYSMDGTKWNNYAAAATVNTDPAVDAAENVSTQLAHVATVGSDKGVCFSGFMWFKARLIVNNVDYTDSLTSNVWRIYCK